MIPVSVTDEIVVSKILLVRGRKVMVDRDLASMYGVETKVLNQAVKRHRSRFPDDFTFQLSLTEFEDWKSQFVTSNSPEKMGLRKRPNVFTEMGVAMLSSVLKSETAIAVNIQIIRIFTRMRELLATQKDVLLKFELLEKRVLQQGDTASRHDEEIQTIFRALKQLLQQPQPERRKIGFEINTLN